MATPPTVTLNGCTIVGKTQPSSPKRPKAVDVFFGVPYATAGRFEAPVGVTPGSGPLTGRLDASKHGPVCPSAMAQGQTAETPLRLNVFRPAGLTPESRMPVVVFFHGGAFNFGTPLDNPMGSFVSHAATGVVVVTVSYRLGVFGFMNGEGGELNLGLKDQRAAVHWLGEWAGAFGGDGGDITLMGVSAGAHSIGHHMLNPQQLPVRKLILESGSPTARSVFHATHPRTTANAQALTPHLRRRTPAQCEQADLVQAGVMVWAQHMGDLTWPFQPVVDGPGGVVPDMPLRLWDGFRGDGVAVLTGFCSHEGMDFIPKRPPPFRSFFGKLIPGLTTQDLETLEALYPETGSTPAAQGKRLGEAYGHYAYICPILHTAHAASVRGARVYLYEFAAITSAASWSAAHASHTQTLTRDTPSSQPGLRDAGTEMHTRWVRFISSTATTSDDPDPSWPVFRSPFGADPQGEGELLVFGEGNTESVGGSDKGTAVQTRRITQREKDVCRFWWDRMELSQGMGERGVVSKSW